MSSSSVTTSDGTVVIATDDDTPATPQPPVILHRDPGFEAGIVRSGDGYTVGMHSHRPLDTGSFLAGLLLGALLFFIVQTAMRWHARREAKGVARAAAIGPQGTSDRTAADLAALARRTAALETIVTDPAHRTAQAIDALR